MENKYKYLLLYFIAVSLISVIVCAADKARAKKGKWRIKESTLFLLSAFGGSAAMYITMRIIRHKTLHKHFMIGLPLITAAQAELLIAAVWLGVL
ncbi:MAG: DUF1294 domain-containing protein [Acutalibacteraceae bacterium]